MAIGQELIDNTIDVCEKMFDYIHNQNVTFITYMNKDFPASNIFEEATSFLKEKRRTFYVRHIEKIKQYTRDSKIVVFTVLTNNMNINEVTYQYNDISRLYPTPYKKEVFQIFVNCHYTNYKNMVKMFLNSFKVAVERRFELL